MSKLIVRHNVEDFDRWKAGYDANGAVRDGGGVRAAYVYRSADDPNDVTVIHDFDSVEAAKAFAGMAELKEVMASLGVVGAPQMWFVEEV